MWGEIKLGRIPEFLYDDARQDAVAIDSCTQQKNMFAVGFQYLYGDALPGLMTGSAQSTTSAAVEALRYKDKFNAAFQYFQSRCQHHIHKLMNGKRVIPNACKSKHNANECKREAPWAKLVRPSWMKEPLLICKGLAKKFKLRCSGPRNWLSQILLLRNEEWVNGTMPALCVALAGSNSDVKLNDRLPITPQTHESICKKNSVKKHMLKKSTRNTQRTQGVACGYFCGYVGKRQPTGALETKICLDKLFTLSVKFAGKSKAQQFRAVSQRFLMELFSTSLRFVYHFTFKNL